MKAGTITNWQPSSYDKHTIEREFKQVCRQYGLNICSVEVRDPYFHRYFMHDPGDVANNWHQDGDAPGSTVYKDYVVMWSNCLPTEIRDATGKRYDGAPGDIVVADNEQVLHRAPRGVHRANRWFVRAHIHK